VFQAVFPTVGLGALEAVDERQFHGTEKEKLLYAPRHEFWRTFAEECAEEGVGVSMFLGMSQFIDVGSIGASF
jgi:protein transport protein SEC24